MSHADIVNAWFRERLVGGELGRYTPGFNQVQEALGDLVERLDAAFPSGAAAAPSPPDVKAPAKASPQPDPAAEPAAPQE